MDFQDRGMVTDLTYLDVTILRGTSKWRLTEDDDEDDENDEDEDDEDDVGDEHEDGSCRCLESSSTCDGGDCRSSIWMYCSGSDKGCPCSRSYRIPIATMTFAFCHLNSFSWTERRHVGCLQTWCPSTLNLGYMGA